MKRLHQSYVDRYFKKFFKVDLLGKSCEDQCVLLHSNRVCVVTLADSHKLLSEGVVKVDFNPKERLNRLDNKFSGKKKRGAQVLQPDSVLCEVICQNGNTYKLRSCVGGKLMEVNEKLITNPKLLAEKPLSDGYIAVILPKAIPNEKITEKLLTADQYQDALTQRHSLHNKANFESKDSKEPPTLYTSTIYQSETELKDLDENKEET